jgi:RNA polymerase sigma factor (sigma-70 family)
MKKQWGLSQSEFDRLLSWLGAEPEQAGEKYESIRKGLIELFEGWNCCQPEDLADETINRVVVKVDSIAPKYSGDPALYFYGVAKNVRHEYLRQKPILPLLPNVASPLEHSDKTEELYACLDQCLDELSATDKNVILMYYQGDKKAKVEARKWLGEQINVTSNALRVRVYRIRSILERCVEQCVETSEQGNKSS